MKLGREQGEMPRKEAIVKMEPNDLDDLFEVSLIPDSHLFAFGFEEDEEDDEAGEDEESEDEDDESEDADEEDEEDDEKASAKGKKESTDGLKSALRKERQARRQAAKELKGLKKELDELKGKKEKETEDEDKEKTRKETEAQRIKSERLAAKLLTNAVDTAIIKAAGTLKDVKFKDMDDVLKLLDRDEIDVDQDDDDPSEIEIDEDSVKDALKSLARRKKHLLVSKADGDEEGAGGKTGSKFNGKRSKDKATEEELKKKYPALARR